VKSDRWLCTALGLILGGAIGNCYDRIVFRGVRDFLYFYRIEYPVFNFADCCLVVGTGILVIQSFVAKEPPAALGGPAVPPATTPAS
jgi:lipoprotein signal peptidase